ncbi:octaprenyl diphosphate synthase [Fastidiosibacter lacustris]|uniref:octaprenyl diphosphate synthase n=1 Tax=Fastidiosibacter lacustris TaxID=2056695 RepID=UPI000E345814|nr:octaprenyl diphosphate synthase [Fastidiosibacter lacustris]
MLNLKQIQQLITYDTEQNNDVIVEQLASDVVLINQISQHIIHSGGKRLRPLLLMLVARALNYQGQAHTKAAAIIEFIHTATLLHDDVVDESDMRRGKQTANNVFGNAASVLTGDFLYSRAFQMMVELNEISIMQILADATNKIAEGEVLQLLNCHNPNVTEDGYMQVIYCKTAKLFEAACDVASIIAKANSIEKQALHNYGMNLGNAFQIADDILDYISDVDTLGKNIGDDLTEGKTTLPVIYALRNANNTDANLIRNAIEQGHHPQMDKIINIIKQSGAIEYAIGKAQDAAQKAIDAIENLAHSSYKEALIALAHIAVERTH